MDTLHASAPTVHDHLSDANFPTAGLPDDFAAFMADALAGESPITGSDLDAMWAHEMQLRDAERELSDAIREGIALNMTLSDALAQTFPFLRAG
jgi:hypothetical protein